MPKTKEDLQLENGKLMEELYKAGVRIRPTMLTKIEEVEKVCTEELTALEEKTTKAIDRLIKNRDRLSREIIDTCEKETGRGFSACGFNLPNEINFAQEFGKVLRIKRVHPFEAFK